MTAARSITATMTANTGLVGMYGENVAQNGDDYRRTTALEKSGEIELDGLGNEVSTGAGSITSSPSIHFKADSGPIIKFSGRHDQHCRPESHTIQPAMPLHKL